MRLDGQCIGIIKDKETENYVDYFFVTDLICKDPRFVNRNMIAGECRGLFRIDKKTLDAELIFSMVGDAAEKVFHKAAFKVLKEFRLNGNWPNNTQFVSG